LKKEDIRWVPKMSFLSHLAMSTVKEGGFFSEFWSFPLENATKILVKGRNNQYELPNEERFTCHDRASSLLSASHEEWNRILNLLLDNMEKNAFWTLRIIRRSDPSSIIRQFKTYNVDSSDIYMDICESSFVRVNVMNIAHLNSFISSLINIREARCFSTRPLMFTFFHTEDKYFNDNDKLLLELWEEAWSDSGWEPVILTLEHAQSHPNYNLFLSKLSEDEKGTRFYGGKDRYNFYYYYRFLAMTVAGGGWMTHYDTLPLYFEPSFTLPNNGALSIYSHGQVELVSGSAAEWNRAAILMYDNYVENSNNGNENWNGNFEINKIMEQELITSNSISIEEVYDIYVFNDKEEKVIPNPFDLSDKCHKLEDFKVIHFSHVGCIFVEFCSGFSQRPLAVRKWYQSWLEQCHSRPLDTKTI